MEFWPSNFSDDELAVKGQFMRIRVHVNAYPGCCTPEGKTYGDCSGQNYGGAENGPGHAKFTYSGSNADCHGTIEESSTPAWPVGSKMQLSWEGRSEARKFSVFHAGLSLFGTAVGDGGTFDVHQVIGPVDPSTDRPRGTPGGPIFMDVMGKDYGTANLLTGYAFGLSGWLKIKQ